MNTATARNIGNRKHSDPNDFLAGLEPEVELAINSPNADARQRFDSSAAAIFALIAQGHSLSSAARSIPMAYSKAWKLVNSLEAAFQVSLVVHRKGGQGYYLTEHGQALLTAYESVQESASRKAQDKYACLVIRSNA